MTRPAGIAVSMVQVRRCPIVERALSAATCGAALSPWRAATQAAAAIKRASSEKPIDQRIPCARGAAETARQRMDRQTTRRTNRN